ncbi:MAG: glycerol-3-phosphate dehydrogenase/oxidase [Bdellovibrionales bacterium]|nr:glycerol-3-phosphate dehydrogenase/oxidase [Bdellovibrionales bacterium]
MNSEFSFASRRRALERFSRERFDLLVVGGGITGAATARDAASRGLKVALVERDDFASGTSSASSKLVHGGLRYLENFEFKLVFESLSERAHLIRTQPNMVRWLKFYLPVYANDKRGMGLVSIGLWLYDLLSLFRAPHFHKRLSKERMLREIPKLSPDGLLGGFTYYDASMWDDVMCVENARAAHDLGATIATRVEAHEPIWHGDRIEGFRCLDRESGGTVEVRAKRTIVCGGPYTDLLGEVLLRGAPAAEAAKFRERSGQWKHWLKPSRGTHLVFARDRLPVAGAMLLSNIEDTRVSFVIPRDDFGPGAVIVGTTDAESPRDPADVRAEDADVDYLLRLLARYFPEAKLERRDILATYVGVRPLMDPAFGHDSAGGSGNLAKVSREHHIGEGPGGTTMVAGGKYTTHRPMALEIVDRALAAWAEDFWRGNADPVPGWHQPRTEVSTNPAVTADAVARFRAEIAPAIRAGKVDPNALEELIERYGADAREVLALHAEYPESGPSPLGFPYLEAQLRYGIRREMVLRLEDFYFRRLPLYLCRKDHGEEWIEPLSRVWAEELGRTEAGRQDEGASLRAKLTRRDQGYRS